MENLKKHSSWIIIIILYIASAIVYFTMAIPKHTEIEKQIEKAKTKRIQTFPIYYCKRHPEIMGEKDMVCEACKKPLDGVIQFPSELNIKNYFNYINEITKERKEVMDFYVNIDNKFERWFPELKLENINSKPDVGFFSSYLSQEFKRIRDKLEIEDIKYDFKQKIFGKPSNKGGFDIPKPNSGSDIYDLKSAQKKFWIQEKVAQAAIDYKINRFEAVQFELVNVYKPKQNSKYTNIIKSNDLTPSRYVDELRDSRFKEGVRIIRFAVSVQLPYFNVEPFIHSILEFDPNNPMFITLDTCKVVKLKNAPNEVTPDKYTEPPIKLIAVFDVVDVDFSEIILNDSEESEPVAETEE